MKRKKIYRFLSVLGLSLFFTLLWSLCAFARQEYVVKLQDGAGAVSLAAEEEAILEPVIPAWSLYRTDEAGLEAVRQMPGVAYIEPVVETVLAESELPPVLPDDPRFSSQWNMNMVGMPTAWYWGMTGSGVRVGLIDSGVNAAHEDLKGSIIAERNYANDDHEDSDLSHVDPENVADSSGHGTLVAGIIAAQTGNGVGIAGVSGAELVSLKAVGASKRGNTLFMLNAIKEAVDVYHCDIINISLTFAADVKYIREAIGYAVSQGVIVVAASGNTSDGAVGTDGDQHIIRYPAGYDGVVGVGSVDRAGAYYTTSVANASVDICAPGRSVLTTSSTGGYTNATGTSFAAPHVTGAAAVLKGVWPELSPALFQSLIEAHASDCGTPGWDKEYGYGLLNLPDMLWAVLPRTGQRFLSSRVLQTDEKLSIQYKNISGTPSRVIQFWGISDRKSDILLQNTTTGGQELDADEVITADIFVSLDESTIARSMLWEGTETLRPLLPAVDSD